MDNGISIAWWFDDCYSSSPLVGRFGVKVIYDFGLGKNATVE